MMGLIKLVIGIAIIGYVVNHFFFAEKSERQMAIDYAVREINDKKGDMIDKTNFVKGAYESSKGLVINIQQIDNQNVLKNTAEQDRAMFRSIKSKACANREIKDVLSMDIDVTYVYYNAFDKKLAEVVIDKNTCR